MSFVLGRNCKTNMRKSTAVIVNVQMFTCFSCHHMYEQVSFIGVGRIDWIRRHSLNRMSDSEDDDTFLDKLHKLTMIAAYFHC